MTGLLLDSHAILWALEDDPRLSPRARRAIQRADVLRYSTASLWEIAIKTSLQRDDFRLQADWWVVIPAELRRMGVARLDIEPQDCRAVAQLPWIHRDPFDRLLVAQAQRESLHLLSRDGNLADYGVPVVW